MPKLICEVLLCIPCFVRASTVRALLLFLAASRSMRIIRHATVWNLMSRASSKIDVEWCGDGAQCSSLCFNAECNGFRSNHAPEKHYASTLGGKCSRHFNMRHRRRSPLIHRCSGRENCPGWYANLSSGRSFDVLSMGHVPKVKRNAAYLLCAQARQAVGNCGLL